MEITFTIFGLIGLICAMILLPLIVYLIMYLFDKRISNKFKYLLNNRYGKADRKL